MKLQQFKDSTTSLGMLSEENRKKTKKMKKDIDEYEDDYRFLTGQM
jgi:hypothetical protein